MQLGKNIKLLDKDYQTINFVYSFNLNCPQALPVILNSYIGDISGRFFEHSIQYCTCPNWGRMIWEK